MKSNQTKAKGGASPKAETNPGKARPVNKEMDNSALHELFVNQLKDMYWAEKTLIKSLPKMAKAATSTQLKSAIEGHLRETEEHVTRLERVFDSMNQKAAAKKCEAMTGLLKEGNELINETQKGTMVRDAAIIIGAQKVEHYEIASYGTLRALAQIMGHSVAVNLLENTLKEEKQADSKLTEIAEGFVNKQADTEMED
ncbi:MAG: ferritin-like domain-containing protein [Bacteroidota bacterium]